MQRKIHGKIINVGLFEITLWKIEYPHTFAKVLSICSHEHANELHEG